MKKKPILSLILAFIMMFSMTVCAFAAEPKTADSIAAQATYTPTVSTTGLNTVDIFVSVENNPELSRIAMLAGVSKAMFAMQGDYAVDGASLMTLQHITGELALHVIMYNMTGAIGGQSADSSFNQYYEMAREARLNIDEDRLSESAISSIGSLIICLDSLMTFSSVN